jgi:hypothetical protein
MDDIGGIFVGICFFAFVLYWMIVPWLSVCLWISVIGVSILKAAGRAQWASWKLVCYVVGATAIADLLWIFVNNVGQHIRFG